MVALSSKTSLSFLILTSLSACGNGLTESQGALRGATGTQGKPPILSVGYRIRPEEGPYLFGDEDRSTARTLSFERPARRPDPQEQSKDDKSPAKDFLEVYVNTATQRLRLRWNGMPVEESWPVSSGVRGSDTPIGSHKAQALSEEVVLETGIPGQERIYLPHVLAFADDVAIYGVAPPGIELLGQRRTYGGVRLHPYHARILFEYVRRAGLDGTTVIVF